MFFVIYIIFMFYISYIFCYIYVLYQHFFESNHRAFH